MATSASEGELVEKSPSQEVLVDKNYVDLKIEDCAIKIEPELLLKYKKFQASNIQKFESVNLVLLKSHLDIKDAHNSHNPNDEIIAEIHKIKHDLIEKTRALQNTSKRNWNHSTESYIQENIVPKINNFKNTLWQNLGSFSDIVHGQVLKAYENLFGDIAKPFIDSITIALQDLNLNKDDSFVDVNACRNALFEEIMSTKYNFLKEVNFLYKKIYRTIIPKRMMSLQQRLNLLVGKISSTFITSNGGGSEISAKKAKS